MRFAEDSAVSHSIRSCRDGEIVVNEQRIRHSVIITRESIRPWVPRNLDELAPAHLEELLPAAPEIVLIGTGSELRFPPPHYTVELMGRGIGVEIMANDAACRTFNVLLSEERRVLLALLLG